MLGMGMGLHAAYPVFAEAFNAVVGELDRHLLRPLREVMWGHDENLLNTTEFAQPALFAVEVALFRLLESWGVQPDFVMGHSIGELSAAHVAGVLSLENAAVLVAARGRFMQALPAGGAMFAVQADRRGSAAVAGRRGRHRCDQRSGLGGDFGRRRRGDRDRGPAPRRRPSRAPTGRLACVPFAVDGSDDRRIRNGRQPDSPSAQPTIPIVSNLTGQLAGDDFASAAYWKRHVREAVRFADSVRFAHSAGANRFLEVGPSSGLTASIEELLADETSLSRCPRCARTARSRQPDDRRGTGFCRRHGRGLARRSRRRQLCGAADLCL